VCNENWRADTAKYDLDRDAECKPPFLAWALLWGLGIVVPTVSIFVDIFWKSPFHILGRDFSNLYVAGRLAIEGRTYCIFDVWCFRGAMINHIGLVAQQNYSYPPHALLIAVPFATLPYYASLLTWTVLGSAFFMWAASLYLPRGIKPWMAIATPAALINIWNGHYGFLFGGLWLLSFRLIKSRPERSGILAGLMTFKPHLGLFIAILMASRLRAFLAAVGTTAAVVALSALIFGPSSWFEFLTTTFDQQVNILNRGSNEFYFMMMPSAYVTYGRTFGLLAQAIYALAAIMLLIKYRKLDPFCAATATFVVMPYAFNYDMTVACLGIAVLLYLEWGTLSWPARITLSLAFLVPELTYVGKVVPLLIPPILLIALWLQLTRSGSGCVHEHSSRDRAPPPMLIASV